MKSDREYRDSMDLPMEDLAFAMWGVSDQPEARDDAAIVEHAARKVKMLKDMILATGMSPELLKACMEN